VALIALLWLCPEGDIETVLDIFEKVMERAGS
jgi:hypothetical protein